MRRVPLTLPATGFTFLGNGRSYGTTGARPVSGFRSDDQVTIRHTGEGAPSFGQDGRRPSADRRWVAVLNAGDWVAYEINVAAAAVLEVAVDGSG